jgi:hypothetical protein
MEQGMVMPVSRRLRIVHGGVTTLSGTTFSLMLWLAM